MSPPTASGLRWVADGTTCRHGVHTGPDWGRGTIGTIGGPFTGQVNIASTGDAKQ